MSDNPATSFHAAEIFLYNPDRQLTERGVDTAAFRRYIKVLVASCVAAFSDLIVPEWRAISGWERLNLDDLVLRVCAKPA